MNTQVLDKLITGGEWRIYYSGNKLNENTLFLLPNKNTLHENEMNNTLLEFNEGDGYRSSIVASYFNNDPTNPFIIKSDNISDALLKMEFNLVGATAMDDTMTFTKFNEAEIEFKKFIMVCYRIKNQECAIQQVAMCGWESYYRLNKLDWRYPFQ